MQLSPNFTLGELTRTGTRLPNLPPEDVVFNLRYLCGHLLQPLRDYLGMPVEVTSGYRCVAVNRAVGGVDGSDHTFGLAADLKVAGITAKRLAGAVLACDARNHLRFLQAYAPAQGGHVHVSIHPLLADRRVGPIVKHKNADGSVEYVSEDQQHRWIDYAQAQFGAGAFARTTAPPSISTVAKHLNLPSPTAPTVGAALEGAAARRYADRRLRNQLAELLGQPSTASDEELLGQVRRLVGLVVKP